ncbi:MAG: hypothetical protein ACRDOA_01795 [Streptosporangiaceae bacterium]
MLSIAQVGETEPVTRDVGTAPPLYGKVLSCGKPLMTPVADAVPEYVEAEPGNVWSSSPGCGGSESPRSANGEPRAARTG